MTEAKLEAALVYNFPPIRQGRPAIGGPAFSESGVCSPLFIVKADPKDDECDLKVRRLLRAGPSRLGSKPDCNA